MVHYRSFFRYLFVYFVAHSSSRTCPVMEELDSKRVSPENNKLFKIYGYTNLQLFTCDIFFSLPGSKWLPRWVRTFWCTHKMITDWWIYLSIIKLVHFVLMNANLIPKFFNCIIFRGWPWKKDWKCEFGHLSHQTWVQTNLGKISHRWQFYIYLPCRSLF